MYTLGKPGGMPPYLQENCGFLVQSWGKIARVRQAAIKPRNDNLHHLNKASLWKTECFCQSKFLEKKCDSGIQISAATCGINRGYDFRDSTTPKN